MSGIAPCKSIPVGLNFHIIPPAVFPCKCDQKPVS